MWLASRLPCLYLDRMPCAFSPCLLALAALALARSTQSTAKKSPPVGFPAQLPIQQPHRQKKLHFVILCVLGWADLRLGALLLRYSLAITTAVHMPGSEPPHPRGRRPRRQALSGSYTPPCVRAQRSSDIYNSGGALTHWPPCPWRCLANRERAPCGSLTSCRASFTASCC
jgi:hypothetical protein